MSDQMQIGEVAERIGLSLRTIRYYGEMGLVPPSARSNGGFRLYSESDVDRFRLIMRMKPLDFTLEEMKDVLDLFDTLVSGQATAEEHGALLERLVAYRVAVGNRVHALRSQLDVAEDFAAHLDEQVAWHSRCAIDQA